MTMDGVSRPELAGLRGEIGARRRTLERRLDDGYRGIEEALRAGQDVGAWEDFWIRLLRDYEAVCDQLDDDPLAA